MFDLILDSVKDFHTVEVRRLHRIFGGLYTYLKLLLTELPYLGKNPASDKLDLFMPWTAAIRKNCILPTKKISPEDL